MSNRLTQILGLAGSSVLSFAVACASEVDSGGASGTGGAVGNGGAANTGGAVGNGGVASTGGTVGNGGVASTGGSLGTGGAASQPMCLASASDAAILGDSYVTGALSPALQPALQTLYPTAGQFANYAVAGTSMASGGILGFIPAQLTSALGAQPNLSFVLMDGGGNDILICDAAKYPSCGTLCNAPGSSNQQVCKDIVSGAIAKAKEMMTTAANAGVRDVVYFFYPHIPANNGGYDEILDYAAPLVEQACAEAATLTSGKLTCHFVNPIQAFKDAGGDRNPANFAGDGIHPSAAGQAILADLIYDKMQADCVGLLSSSGCCTP